MLRSTLERPTKGSAEYLPWHSGCRLRSSLRAQAALLCLTNITHLMSEVYSRAKNLTSVAAFVDSWSDTDLRPRKESASHLVWDRTLSRYFHSLPVKVGTNRFALKF